PMEKRLVGILATLPQGLVYRGVKVMPFSTAGSTPLSNFEAGQNYKMVDDPAILLLAWTTTPWTWPLPSNLALCVHPEMKYVRVTATPRTGSVLHHDGGTSVRSCTNRKTTGAYELLEQFPGSQQNLQAIAAVFSTLKAERGAFRVLCDTYVTDDSGTGIVHQAPYHGEDDYRVWPERKVPNAPFFTDEVPDFFQGQHVKEADKNICDFAEEKWPIGQSFQHRAQLPVLLALRTRRLSIKAVPSWFVRVEDIGQQLLDNNQKELLGKWMRSVPKYVQEKRDSLIGSLVHATGPSLETATGHPHAAVGVCVGSIDQLAELSGVRVTDLHRESVDNIEIPSKLGKGPLRRIPEVFDCWFESGSMPYAQSHYPFERAKDFEDAFPADFIARGYRTRPGAGSTLCWSSPLPCSASRRFATSDCLRRSERCRSARRTTPDPMKVVESHGADALRLYLINSPVVRAERISDSTIGRRRLQTAWQRRRRRPAAGHPDSDNVMDKWILSYSQSVGSLRIREEMAAGYRLYTVTAALVSLWTLTWTTLVPTVTNESDEIGNGLLLFELSCLARSVCPVSLPSSSTQRLITFLDKQPDEEAASVHFLAPACADESAIDDEIAEFCFLTCSRSSRLVVSRRDRWNTLPIKLPLSRVIVVHNDDRVPAGCGQSMEFSTYWSSTFASCWSPRTRRPYKGEPPGRSQSHKLLAPSSAAPTSRFRRTLRALPAAALEEFSGLDGWNCRAVTCSSLLLRADSGDSGGSGGGSSLDCHCCWDITPDASMQREGLAREVVNRVQKLRKRAGLQPSDPIKIFYRADGDGDLSGVVREYASSSTTLVRQPLVSLEEAGQVNLQQAMAHEQCKIKDSGSLDLWVFLPASGDNSAQTTAEAVWQNSVIVCWKPKMKVRLPLRTRGARVETAQSC
uniref:isoleucine--tRNA ligase n=1 Tax=Macrostomum lignano TaxID=282301 RepID=A0A1I8F799_9PLAT